MHLACLYPPPLPANRYRALAESGRWLTAPVCLSLVLALSGCAAVLPQRAEPSLIAVPAAWSNTTGANSTGPATANVATSLAQWWLYFDDPLLASLVSLAMQANPGVLGAQAGLQQARALRDVALAGLFAEVGGSASAQRSRAGDDDATNNFRVGLDASYDLDLFGERRSAVNASEATVRASAASLDSARVSVAVAVALAYIALRADQARLVIANDNLASQLETRQITEWRLQAGLLTSIEAEQARTSVELARAQLPALSTRIEQNRHALAVFTGQPPAALSATLAATSPIPRVADDLALSLPADTLRQRPDVRTAEHQVAAARARLAQADAARLPSFKLSGSLGLNALTLGGLSHGAAVVGALLAGVSLPVFDGGAGRAQVRAELAALDEAQQRYQTTVLTALQEVEDALVALRGDRERLLRLQNAADAAGTAARLARLRYQSGLVDFQVVLETQRSQLGSQDSVASATADIGADHVRLYKALGGGWRPDSREVEADSPQASPQTTRTPRS